MGEEGEVKSTRGRTERRLERAGARRAGAAAATVTLQKRLRAVAQTER